MIVVVVLGARAAPFPRLLEAARVTWASQAVEGVETLFYFGGHEERRAGDELVLPVPDDSANIGRKTLACFEHLLENSGFDLLFRTNASSYVHLANLRRYAAKRLASGHVYRGFIGMRGEMPFASGSGYFLSRDLVEATVARKDMWDHKLADDAALAAVLAGVGVTPEPAPRQDFRRIRDVRHIDRSLYHFRCRTDSWRRWRDVRIMKAVHRAFGDARAPTRQAAA